MHYIRVQQPNNKVSVQLIVPKDFLSIKKYEKGLPKLTREIAEEMEDLWKSEAGKRLNTSRQKYIDSIDVKFTAARNAVLTLSGAGMRIETGKPFDMRPGFLKSPKIKQGGKRKLPNDKALIDKIRSKPANPSIQWMIIPLKINGGTMFRTFTSEHGPDMWQWNTRSDRPGKAPARILPDVIEYSSEVIIPTKVAEHIERSIAGAKSTRKGKKGSKKK